jgi:hypothetical protein
MKRETLIWLFLLLAAGVYIVVRVVTTGMGVGYEERINGEVFPANAWDALAGNGQVSIARSIGVWVAALGTLFILSFAYKDSPLYKIAESSFVGVSAAYWMVVGFWSTIIPNLLGKLFPAWIQSWAMPGLPTLHTEYWWLYFFPLVLGVMLLCRLSPKGRHPAHRLHPRRLLQPDPQQHRAAGRARERLVRLLGVAAKPPAGRRSALRSRLLLLLLRAQGVRGQDGQGRHLGPDDHLRGRLRLHRHGPDRAAGHPPGVPL